MSRGGSEFGLFLQQAPFHASVPNIRAPIEGKDAGDVVYNDPQSAPRSSREGIRAAQVSSALFSLRLRSVDLLGST